MQHHDELARDAAFEFYQAKEKFEAQQRAFEDAKIVFYSRMGDYFTGNKGKKAEFKLSFGLNTGSLVVKKVERTSVEWDAEKLLKRVDKETAKEIISKQYHIADMEGLVKYLKSCGVDPKIFKQFISVKKSVNEKALDRLGDTGYLSVKQIVGCYTVKAKEPYFTVTVKDDG